MKKPLILASLLPLVLTSVMPLNAAPKKPAPKQQDTKQSDAEMKAGLSQLNSASMAMQKGHNKIAMQDLDAAIKDMASAQPVYHGYREKSIVAAKAAKSELKGSSINQAESLDDKAIACATAALQGGK